MKLVVGITSQFSTILVKGQLAYFSELGYDVYLLAPEGESTVSFCKEENATLLPVDIKRDISIFSDLKSLYVIWKHFRTIKPDVVNVGTPKMGLLGSLAAKITGVPKRIYTLRGFRFEHVTGFKKRLLKFMDKLAIKSAHQVVCISDSVRQLGLDENMFPIEKTVIFGKGSSNGVDLKMFDPDFYSVEAKDSLKRKWGLSNKFVYGFVGRIVDRKGVNELYSAFLRVKNELPNVHLLIVGGANLEQVADKGLMDKLNADKDVSLPGFIPNVNDYMAVMDVFVLPAWWEGFGNTLVQAAAMGLPIISCDVTGCRDAVNDGFNGVLIPAKNEEKLYETMLEFYHNKPERERLGTNGKIWAKNFDSVLIWEGLKSLYES